MLVATKLCLSRHLFFFFFATNICRHKHVFVVTKVLLRQAYFGCDKRRVLSRQTRVCPDKSKHVSTKLLSRQNYVCRDKHTFVATNDVFCRDKNDTCGSTHLSTASTCPRRGTEVLLSHRQSLVHVEAR